MEKKCYTLIEIFVAIAIIIILIAIVYSVIIVCDANEQDLENGVVISKEYYPEKTYYFLSGKMLVPMTQSEKYYLEIENDEKKDTFAVSKAEYEKYEIGDNYPKEEKDNE